MHVMFVVWDINSSLHRAGHIERLKCLKKISSYRLENCDFTLEN